MKLKYVSSMLIVGISLTACGQSKSQHSANNNKIMNKVEKTKEQWKKELDPETYEITREKGTERAFTGKFYKHDEEGMYTCSNCGLPLFKSEHKYESGSGWPSFYDVASDSAVGELADNSYGMIRTELICNRCDAHLGHVFNDGPNPTGLRYCINSASLGFEEKKEK